MNRDEIIEKIEQTIVYCPRREICSRIDCNKCTATRIYNTLESIISLEIMKNSMPMEWICTRCYNPLQDGYYYVKDNRGNCQIAKWDLETGWITHKKNCDIIYWSPIPVSM